jgi:serine/threonine protein kinase
MGRVVRGFDTKLRREVALKVTKVRRSEMPRNELARFVEEAQITAQLEHPNVAPVHDLGLSPEGHGYFSMKLVRGRSLAEILEARRQGDGPTLSQFGLRRLLDVFQQVCQAIEYAHARGVVHRDLKPANIMVGDFGEVLVMDFGVAKLLEPAEGGVTIAMEEDPSSDSVPPPPPPASRRISSSFAWDSQQLTHLAPLNRVSSHHSIGASSSARSVCSTCWDARRRCRRRTSESMATAAVMSTPVTKML